MLHQTPASLLERLRRTEDQEAWKRFVQLYTPLLCHWARRLGLPTDDVSDFVQDIFVVLVQKLPEFRYDPEKRFRGWLWTLTLNKWRERRRRAPALMAQANDAAVPEPATPDPALELVEAEYRQFVVERALEILRAEFEPATWEAFWEFAVADRPAAEVARELGTSENAVYLAKSRVLRRLRRELAGLLE